MYLSWYESFHFLSSSKLDTTILIKKKVHHNKLKFEGKNLSFHYENNVAYQLWISKCLLISLFNFFLLFEISI